MLAPYAVAVTATALFTLSLKLLIKDSVKASALVSIFLVLFFFYGHVHHLLFRWMTDNDIRVIGILLARHRYLLPFSVILASVSVSLVLRYRGNLVPGMQVATGMMLVLVVWNIGRVGLADLRSWGAQPSLGQIADTPRNPIAGADGLPDIYYFILDGYGRADGLKKIYGFDNSKFIDSLTQKGFYVASKSRSNYVQTSLSLPSSLNMRYLDERDDPRNVQGWNRRLKDPAEINNNVVSHFVKSMGYQWVQFDSGWGERKNPLADIQFIESGMLPLLLNRYSSKLAESTIADALLNIVGLDLTTPFRVESARLFTTAMREVRTVPDIPGPTFSFLHSIPPHPPAIFDRAGNVRKPADSELNRNWWGFTDLYVDQLIYVNQTIESVVDEILERSAVEPIIIIQADHGTALSESDMSFMTGSIRFENPSESLVFERTGILNAYYLPEYCNSGLYATITPVNTFRLVFDNCFGTDFGLLEDVTYWSSYGRAHDFQRVDP